MIADHDVVALVDPDEPAIESGDSTRHSNEGTEAVKPPHDAVQQQELPSKPPSAVDCVVDFAIANWFFCCMLLVILIAWASPGVGKKGGPLRTHPRSPHR